jgi:hypothetical protein
VADTPARFANALKTANKLVRPVPRSGLYPLLSRRLMLLDYTGARTGPRCTFPIGYFPWDDGGVLAFSSQRWPGHIRRARSVRLLIHGRSYHAAPTVTTDPQAKADLLAEFTRRTGRQRADARPARQPPGPPQPATHRGVQHDHHPVHPGTSPGSAGSPGRSGPGDNQAGHIRRPHQD